MREVEHARWRFSSVRCLLESHRLLRKDKPGWQQQETDYVKRFATARAELERLEKL